MMSAGKQDIALNEWLGEFRKKTTQRTYKSALKKFKKALEIRDLGEYVKNGPDVVSDIRKFLGILEGKPSKTIGTYSGAVRLFLQDQGIKVPDDEWRKIRRRGFMPKRVKAETRDKKPTKLMLRKLLNYADIKCRSMVLFLISSGARIGETLQLQIADFNLDTDPPEAHIKNEYTKGGAGDRIVYFSYEARDAIKDWLAIKDKTNKRTGEGTYKSGYLFGWGHSTARDMWNRCCDKAGLDTKDRNTGRRIYHLHSLRKFFRSNIGLDLDVTHSLMGHAEYLDDSYLRLEQDGEIAKVYLEVMPNVSLFESTSMEVQSIQEKLDRSETENLELRASVSELRVRMSELETEFSKMKKIMEK